MEREFITYAHRGASEYCPENTMMSFYTGMKMGANGIETDVRKTKDQVLILFHDKTLDRVTNGKGNVSDFTFEEISKLLVAKQGLVDKIVTLEDFLAHFCFRDITFAIELKEDGIEKEVLDLVEKYNVQDKVVITAFEFYRIANVKKLNSNIKVGYLVYEVNDKIISELKSINAEEVCPIGREVTADGVKKWHELGFNVRAWGIVNKKIMKKVYDAGVNGMTANFPDSLLRYISKKTK